MVALVSRASSPSGRPRRRQAAASGGDRIQALRPFGPEGAGQLAADARRQPGAPAAGRHGQQQIAAAHLSGVVEVAKGDDVLDVDQAARGARRSGERRRLGERQVDDPDERDGGQIRRSRAAGDASARRRGPRARATAGPKRRSGARRRPRTAARDVVRSRCPGRPARSRPASDRRSPGSCAAEPAQTMPPARSASTHSALASGLGRHDPLRGGPNRTARPTRPATQSPAQGRIRKKFLYLLCRTAILVWMAR